MRPLFIVPLKKNSKRLPNKNFLDFCGKPLFEWSLEQTVIASKNYPGSKIIVATDAIEEVVRLSLNNADVYAENVEIFKLPDWLCQDPYQLASPCVYVIKDTFNRDLCASFDCFVLVQITNPLILAEDIIKCIDSYINYGKSIRSFTNVDRLWMLEHNNEDCSYLGFIPVPKNMEIMQSCVGVLVQDISSFSECNDVVNAKFDINVLPYNLPKERAVDIDDSIDFEYAKVLMKRRLMECDNNQ